MCIGTYVMVLCIEIIYVSHKNILSLLQLHYTALRAINTLTPKQGPYSCAIKQNTPKLLDYK